MTTGDFNTDDKLDLTVANVNDNTISVLLGNGDRTFQNQTTYSTGASPTFVIVDDFNSDDKLDLAVTNSGIGTISVLFGNGNGTFLNYSLY